MTTIGFGVPGSGAAVYRSSANSAMPIATKWTGGVPSQRTLLRPERLPVERPEPALGGLERRADLHDDVDHMVDLVRVREIGRDRRDRELRGGRSLLLELRRLETVEIL